MLQRHLEGSSYRTERFASPPPASQLVLASSRHSEVPHPNLHADMIIHAVMQRSLEPMIVYRQRGRWPCQRLRSERYAV